MKENSSKKYTNSFHLRIYDMELLKSLNELLDTKKYESMNELLNSALAIGMEKIYLEFGKRKIFAFPNEFPEMSDEGRIDRVEHQLEKVKILTEDMYILMNSIEALTASIFNVQRASLKGEPLNEELLDSGYLAELPDTYREIKANLVSRFSRKLSKEKQDS